jgi:hypothetical protein
MRNNFLQRTVLAAIVCAAGLGPAGTKLAAQQQTYTTLDAALKTAGNSLPNHLDQGTKLAVLNFSSDSAGFSRYTVEELTAILVQTEQFVMIDQQAAEAVRQEMEIPLSGDASDDSAQAAGKRLGAEAIITGSLTSLANGYRMWLKVIKIETRQTAFYYRCTILNDANMARLMGLRQESASAAPAAEDFAITQNKDGKTITIDNYKGSARSIIIPKELYGLPVTDIRERAFQKKGLTSVVISAGITTIGSNAFSENRLTSIAIPGSVTAIESSAFYGNQLTSIMLEQGLTTIGSNAFGDNLLTSVTIPDSVTSIGSESFSGNQLPGVILGRGLTRIESGAFSGNQLTSVTIAKDVSSISAGAGFEQSFINFYESENRTPGTYVKNGPIWSKAAAQQAAAQQAAAQTPSAAAEYAVGDTGPAGGIVFFDKGVYTDGWRYLEAAPSDIDYLGSTMWQWGDTYIETSTNGGTGKANTQRIVAALEEKGETNRAAQLCAALDVNGYRDWFLPSKNELNWMYVNLKTEGLGGFGEGWYWSSSQYRSIYDLHWAQRFSDGSQSNGTNNSTCSVRAVRAF